MVFNLCWNKNVDELLAHLVWNRRLEEAGDCVRVYVKIHQECKLSSTDISELKDEEF